MNTVIEKVLASTFIDLAKPDLDQVFEAGKVIFAKSGQTITDPIDNDHSLYVCLSGVVKVNYSAESGEEVSLTYLRSGELFGELSAIDQKARSATCIAKTDCSLIKIPSQNVLKLLNESPAFNRSLMLILIGRIRKTDKKLFSIAKRTASQRIADELIQLAHPDTHNPDSAEIPFIPKQQELGLLAMASREKASRSFNLFRKEGLLEKLENSIKIPSIKKLNEFSNSCE